MVGASWLDKTDSFVANSSWTEVWLDEASSLLADTSACIQKRSGLVPTVSVISFGLLICFGPFCRIHLLLDEMDSFVCKTASWTRWITRSVLLVCKHFGMYTEEVLIGSNSTGLCVWSQNCVLVHFGRKDLRSVRNGQLCCNSSWARWIGSSVLVCKHFGMYMEEVWIGSNHVSHHFVCCTHLFCSSF